MTASHHADRPALGVMLMLGFCVLAPLGDASAKLLGESVGLVQILFIRFAIQTLVLVPIVMATGGGLLMTPRTLRLTAIRTALHIVGIGAMFSAFRFLPLADAIAIAFVMPFLMLILGHFALGEEVGRRRIAACAVGFVGVLLVVQPSFEEVGAPALLPLVVAVAFALFMLVTRQMAKDVNAVTLQATSGIMATVGLGAIVLMVPGDLHPAFALKWPEGREVWLLLAIGLLGTLAHLLMTWSLRFAPSATLAPMQYLEIPFATLVGWAVFSEFPNGLAAIGICVTMASGLYIVFRERAMAKAAAV